MNKSVWSKKEAIKEIGKLMEDAKGLTKVEGFSENHVSWTLRTSSFLKEVFGQDSTYYQTFNSLTWKHEGSAIIGGPARPRESMNPQLGIDRVNQETYLKHLGIAKGLLSAAREELKRKDIEKVYKGKDTGPEASVLLKVLSLAEHKLRKTIRNKPNREKEVQDAFENLLIGAEVPYSRETDSIEYSTKTYIPDFSIQRADLAIDIKLCTKSEREKDIIAEINDDILAYKTKYGNLIFIVYDLGIIRDMERFIGHFQKHGGVIVRVVKH